MEIRMLPWNWGESARGVSLSPPSSCSTPESCESYGDCTPPEGQRHRRGRPRADHLPSLPISGNIDHGAIRCTLCHRIFPREKSLQAHMRTHTGERPYNCDFPNCTKAFCQSGQLKTHQRLHTGEKPFVCSASGCNSRFTHANRRCPDHPLSILQREKSSPGATLLSPPNQNERVTEWLARYNSRRQEKTPSKLKTKQFSREIAESANTQHIEARKRSRDLSVYKLSDRGFTMRDKRSEWRDGASEQRDKLISALALIELANSGFS